MGIKDGTIPEGTSENWPHLFVELPPTMQARRVYIRRAEVETYGPTRGCPGFQKVVSGPVPFCTTATHNDANKERMEKLMMQHLKRRIALSERRFVSMKHSRDMFKRMKRERESSAQNIKNVHHGTRPGQGSSSASSSR